MRSAPGISNLVLWLVTHVRRDRQILLNYAPFMDDRQTPDMPAFEEKGVTPEQAAIAKRMNIKDPAKALQNFVKRQETGESRFGAVANLASGEF